MEVFPDEGPVQEHESQQMPSSSFIPHVDEQPLEYDRLKNSLNQNNYLDISSNPYNEFNTLFPDGKGDPTNKSLIRQISSKDNEWLNLYT